VLANGGSVTPSYAGSDLSTSCPAYSQVSFDDATGATQTNGLGDSTREPVTAPDGRCLNVEYGISDGANVILYPCSQAGLTDNEAWVFADDGSLRLKGNYCLSTDGNGAAVVEPCPTTGDVADLWTAQAGGQLAQLTGGACLTSGERTTTYGNTQVYLGDCASAPGWTLPLRP
jgi:hypothetical protein